MSGPVQESGNGGASIFLLITAVLSLLAASPAIAAFAMQPGDRVMRAETKNRLSFERMERMVSVPLAIIRRGDVAGGERSFEALHRNVVRRHGATSVEAADLLMAFGAVIHTDGRYGSESTAPNAALQARSLLYVRRAVAAYRATFGPDHPEVALALHSLADIVTELSPDDPSAEADAAFEEALRIRRAALGPSNAETLAALGRLADVRSLPSRTRRDPARIAAAAALYREALSQAQRAPGPFPEQQPTRWYIRLIRLYARNGQAAAALATFAEAAEGQQCMATHFMALEAAELLGEGGHDSEAQTLRERFTNERLAQCPELSDDLMLDEAARLPLT
jgi:tetratricopeptide (TPR) repeat protein